MKPTVEKNKAVMMPWAAAPLQQRQEPQHRLPAPERGPGPRPCRCEVSATWNAGTTADPHVIELEAAVDNKEAPEGLPLAPWACRA